MMLDQLKLDVKRIDAALAAAKIPSTKFYREVPIAHTTWERWRSGKTRPNFSTWQRCLDAFAKLCPAKTAAS